jgi:hypothetical protein
VSPKVSFLDALLILLGSEECGAAERELRIRSVRLERRGHNGAAHDAFCDISLGREPSLSHKINAAILSKRDIAIPDFVKVPD